MTDKIQGLELRIGRLEADLAYVAENLEILLESPEGRKAVEWHNKVGQILRNMRENHRHCQP